MYPQRELVLLADRKALLRQSIAQRRVQCTVDASRIAKPLEWLDRALALWRRVPSLAKLVAFPVGLLVIKRAIFPRRTMNILGHLAIRPHLKFSICRKFIHLLYALCTFSL